MTMWAVLSRKPDGAAGDDADYIAHQVIPVFTNNGEMPINRKKQCPGIVSTGPRAETLIWFDPRSDVVHGEGSVPANPGHWPETDVTS